MALESANFISELQKSDPKGTDLVSEGDDHLRLIKKTLQNSFPVALDAPLIPDITDKGNHVLATNSDASAIEWTEIQAKAGEQFFRYWKEGNQIISSGQGWVRVTYEVEKEDADSVWDASTFTVGVDGLYHIEANWRLATAAIPDHDMAIRVNGEVWKQLSYTDYNSGTMKFHSMQIYAPVMLTAGDVVDIAANTESELAIAGGNNALGAVSGYRIR